MTYIIYSTTMQGYWNGSGYTSEWKKAKHFTNVEASEFCKKHVTHEGAFGMLPIPLYMLEAIL